MLQKRSPKPLPSLQQISKPKKTPLLWSILLGVLLLSLVVLVLILVVKRPSPPHRVGNGQESIHVLFIGNSYTFVNNLPGLLIELAAHEAKPIDAEIVAFGGARLADHWTQGQALAAIRRERWDYVVLQEQSTLGSGVVVNNVEQIGDPKLFH